MHILRVFSIGYGLLTMHVRAVSVSARAAPRAFSIRFSLSHCALLYALPFGSDRRALGIVRQSPLSQQGRLSDQPSAILLSALSDEPPRLGAGIPPAQEQGSSVLSLAAA